jgi:bifunctional ADP-heptose synthase (sugar kinase/adenylyltransferase)
VLALTVDRLSTILQEIRGCRVLVVGDVILDEYVWGRTERISPEAPIPVVDIERRSMGPGGAANAARSIAALGGEVSIAGVIGDDDTGPQLLGALQQIGVSDEGLVVDESRPTTRKTRVLAQGQQVVRLDYEDRSPISLSVCDSLLERLNGMLDYVQSIVVADYDKGVLTPTLTQRLFREAADRRLPVVVDPKPNNVQFFRGATIVTPNEKEAIAAAALIGLSGSQDGRGFPTSHLVPSGAGHEFATSPSDDEALIRAARALRRELSAEYVLVTRSERGMMLLSDDGVPPDSVPAVAKEVYDATGAGDTVSGTLGLCMAAGTEAGEAMRLANLAAGVVVRKLGCATASPEEIVDTARRLEAP